MFCLNDSRWQRRLRFRRGADGRGSVGEPRSGPGEVDVGDPRQCITSCLPAMSTRFRNAGLRYEPVIAA